MRLSNSTHAFFSSLRAQLRTLGALAVRDAASTYGHQNPGFFWLMAEPLVFAGAVMILWAFTRHGRVQEVVGLVVAGLSEIFEAVDKFVDEALHGLIPLTGTFEMVDWLPQQAQTVMLHSPLVNAIEILRGSSPSSATRRNRSIPARRPARRSSWWRAWASNSPGWRRR